MKAPEEKDFEVLRCLESFLLEDTDAEIDRLTEEEIEKQIKATGFNAAAVMKRTREALARAQDRENRAKARARTARVNEIAKTITTTVRSSVEEFRSRLSALCQQDPSLALQFRAFEELEDPAELEQAIELLDKLEAEQEKADG
jgi:hypothetical protein